MCREAYEAPLPGGGTTQTIQRVGDERRKIS